MDSNGSKRAKSRNSQRSLFTEQSSRFINKQPEWKLKGIAILQSTKYRLFIIIFNVLSISQFIGLLYLMKNFEFFNYIDSWIKYALAINSVFLIDLIAHIVMFGFKRVVSKKTEYLCELLLQIAAQVTTIFYIFFDLKHEVRTTRMLSIILLLRNLRLLSLLWEL